MEQISYRLEEIDSIKEQLQKVGWVVLEDIITAEDCSKIAGQFREWISIFGPESKFENINSIIHKYGASHLAPTWDVRLRVKKVFAAIWGTEKLLSSMDGIAIGVPPESNDGDSYWEEERHTLHLDQSFMKKGLHAYQGAVYLENSDEDDWCFLVMDSSHVLHDEFFVKFPRKYPTKPADEYQPLSDTEVDWYKSHGCDIRRVPVKKGGMVLWDSRLVHAGALPKRGRKHPDRWRFVTFVSMTPAIWATDEDIQTKKKAYNEMRTTPHWSSQGVSIFDDCRDSPDLDLQELPDLAKTDTACHLMGVAQYDFKDGTCNGPDWRPKWDKADYNI